MPVKMKMTAMMNRMGFHFSDLMKRVEIREICPNENKAAGQYHRLPGPENWIMIMGATPCPAPIEMIMLENSSQSMYFFLICICP